MGAIQQIFQQYADAYLNHYGDAIPLPHRRVIRDIQNCRTPAAGLAVYTCTECERPHPVFCGCGNRHCPNCQHARSQQWLRARQQEQLPAPHFLLTVTVPEPLRRFMRSHPAQTYAALFDTAAEAIRELAANPRYVGGDLPGFFGVLHTWGRTLEYHPHIHFVVPGGAVDRASGLWKPARPDFFVPVRALSALIRGKFRHRMDRLGFLSEIEPAVWRQDWNVNSQAVGNNAGGVLRYLAAYVFRVAISDSRILSVRDDHVTFSYRRGNNARPRRMTLHVFEFIRRFLQHVLPRGFMKIRYYGFMGAGCRIPYAEIETMVRLAYAFDVPEVESSPLAPPSPFRCPHCGGRLRFVRFTVPDLQECIMSG